MAKGVAFSVPDMKAQWKSKYVGKSQGTRDRIEKNRGGVSYYLLGNEIAFYDPETKIVTISDAGWQTSTTKDRLNGLLYSGKSKARIHQKDGIWYLQVGKAVTLWPGTYKFKV